MQRSYPLVHYHISSGNSLFVMEYLDKGLLDFGIVFGYVERKDSPLAVKEAISPEDLQDKPLVLSQQEAKGGILTEWLKYPVFSKPAEKFITMMKEQLQVH